MNNHDSELEGLIAALRPEHLDTRPFTRESSPTSDVQPDADRDVIRRLLPGAYVLVDADREGGRGREVIERLSAEGGADTVPVTHSTSTAAFLVEETDVGVVRVNAGARVERVKRKPVTGVDRSFNLKSASVGGMSRASRPEL